MSTSTATATPLVAAAVPTRTLNRGQVRQLLRIHWLEMSRNRSTFIFVLIFPFIMLSMFLGINYLVASGMDQGPDFSIVVVPMGLCLAITGTCTTLTAGPIADYRSKGTLRTLSTTPISRSSFLLTHMAVRLVLSFLLSGALILLGVALGIVSLESVWRVLAASIPATILFLGIGYLVGGLMKNGQGAMNVASAVQLVTLFTSGVAVPFAVLPESAFQVIDLLPTAYFGDLLFWTTGSPLQRYDTWLDFLVASVCALIVVPLAIRFFRWDTHEK
ncbi:MAG: ABC transporter permease [Ancrocorticia sp.]